MGICTIKNNPLLESCCVVSVAVSGTVQKTITLTLEDGQTMTSAFTDENTTYDISYTNGVLTLTPSTGTPTSVNIFADLISSDSDNLLVFGTDGKLFVDDNTTSIINTQLGHKIASYVNEDNVSFDINETVTSITGATLDAANILEISYRNENGVSTYTTVDLSTLAADIKVLSLQYDAVTNTIEITNTDGTVNNVTLTDIIDVITNTLTITGNTLESVVNGVSDSVNVITSSSLSRIADDLVMSVNGVQASIPVSQIADGTETKVNAGTGISISGVGSQGNPYTINSTITDTNTTYTTSIAGNIITLTGSDGSVQNIVLPATAAPDGSETKVNAGTGITITGTGTVANPYIITNSVSDTNTTYTLSILGNVATLTGSNGSVNNITLPSSDGSETKLNAGTNVTLTGTGTTADPYIINATSSATADGSETKINAGTNVTVTGTGTTTSPYVINSTTTVDGSETKVNAGTNTTVTGTGTTADPYIINATSVTADGSETKVSAGTNIAITGNGTLATPYVVSATDTDTKVTAVAITGTNTKTITLTLSDGSTVSGNFTDLQGSGGPSADADNILYAGSDGGPLLKITDLISADAGNTAVVGTDDKVYVPAPGCCPVTLDIFQGDEIGTDVINLTLADGTVLEANTGPLLSEDNPGMNDLRVGTDGGLYYDLSSQLEYMLLAEKRVIGIGVEDQGATKIISILFADNTTVNTTFPDLDTNTTYTFSISGNVITATGSDGSVQNITLPSGTAPDGSETKVTAGTNVTVTGTGTTADPYIINSSGGAAADGSETKINVGTGLSITGAGTTASPYVLVNTVTDTDTNTTYSLSIAGTNVTLTGSDGSTSTIALPTGTADTNTTYTLAITGTNLVFTGSDGTVTTLAIPCSCDGSETKVTAGTNTSVTGTGTTANPYVINSTYTSDGSDTKVTAGTGISVTGSGTTASPYVVNSTVVDTNTTYSLSISGNTLTLTPSSGTAQNITLPVSDGSETKLTAGTNVSITGVGTTASPYVVNSTDTNTTVTTVSITGTETKTVTLTLSDGSTVAGTFTDEDTDTTYTMSVSGNSLTLTPSTGTAQTITLPTADGSETKLTAGTGVSITGTGTTASPYTITNTVTDTNTTYSVAVSGNTLTLTPSSGTAQNVTLPTSDGSETIVTAGTGISVTGAGTTASPYVVTSAADGSETKVQTSDALLSVAGSGTTASPYAVSYVGPRVLYKYCAYITGGGGPGIAPTVTEVYDNIPGGVGAWAYNGCAGFNIATTTYSFNRANTIVQVTPITQWAGLAVAGQGNGTSLTLGVTDGSTYVAGGGLGCPFSNGTDSFVVYYEVTVYDTNPNP